ncbi:MFS transporter [Tuwongella immobilis]|uniref:Major facilitator superfamily (MFS) profile domain-containing protein n=1 Tax=Tuwongella immobilis TaxID=692036 RepID=A0A6C2YVG0_9BACT|nr:MFS transporter [Tuwongella immobilis]VIP04895.1 membrane protein : Major facilitator superfamily MFS_1 OS=Chthoniobacter flavus Ellin428 GN=CfE428DRAFT_2805 PE=4 SV=1: MFS_1 [Tuwongella immobilis]VTS07149.1 membrane protein : Major facilitator superfamily MFS_1 OS=Chthoniobacter flavus Ellin428 GN=CfE428DRAFT_2805 PE=4 SV=1: MFS_1 [Tuwongella immobilis]
MTASPQSPGTTDTPPPASGPIAFSPAWRWSIVWLMFFATMINYMDRQALNSASPHIKQEFGLSEQDYGNIEFAFGLAFAIFQIVAGFLVDRFSIRVQYLLALLIWSAAGIATGLSNTLNALLMCRVILGIGEAFNWPCAVATVRRIVPRDQRALANGIFHSGATIGAVLTPLLAVLLISSGTGEGWRNLFYVVGALGGVWAIFWIMLTRGVEGRAIDTPAPAESESESANEANTRMRDVFAMRRFWIAIIVGCSVNFCWHFYRIWFVRYMDLGLAIQGNQLQYLLAGFYICADLGSLIAGYFTQWFSRNGWTVERSRKIVMVSTALLCLLTTPALWLGSSPWAFVLFYLVAAGSMGGFANYFALSQDIVSRHTGQILGIIGATSWFLIAPVQPLVGAYYDQHQTFVPIFIGISFVPIAGALVGCLWPEPKRS